MQGLVLKAAKDFDCGKHLLNATMMVSPSTRNERMLDWTSMWFGIQKRLVSGNSHKSRHSTPFFLMADLSNRIAPNLGKC